MRMRNEPVTALSAISCVRRTDDKSVLDSGCFPSVQGSKKVREREREREREKEEDGSHTAHPTNIVPIYAELRLTPSLFASLRAAVPDLVGGCLRSRSSDHPRDPHETGDCAAARRAAPSALASLKRQEGCEEEEEEGRGGEKRRGGKREREGRVGFVSGLQLSS